MKQRLTQKICVPDLAEMQLNDHEMSPQSNRNYYPFTQRDVIKENDELKQASEIKCQQKTLKNCIAKIKQHTYYKNFNRLTNSQRFLINDLGSLFTHDLDEQNNKKKKKKQKPIYEQSKTLLSHHSLSEMKYHAGRMQSFFLFIIAKLKSQKLNNNLRKKCESFIKYTIEPNNPIILIWNFIISLIIIHTTFSLPLEDAFGREFLTAEQDTYQALIIAEMIIMFLDILLQFNVNYLFQGNIISKKTEISIIYFRSQFVFDIFSLIGILIYRREIYINVSNKIEIEIFFSILKYLFLFKYVRLNKFMIYFGRIFNKNQFLKHYFNLIKLFLFLLILAHFIACLWVVTAKASQKYLYSMNWISIQEEYSNPYHIYLKSLYFASMTMTTVGYGDIHPQNPAEYLVSVIIMIISSGIFAYSLNTITKILQEIQRQKSKCQREIEIIENYMKNRKIDLTLQTRIINYLTSMDRAGLYDEQEEEQNILAKLNPQLMHELLLQDKGKVLMKIPFFKNHFNKQFLIEIIKQFNEIRLSPGEFLKKQNTDSFFMEKSFIYVAKGSVDIIIKVKKQNQNILKLFTMKQDESLGLINLFSNIEVQYQNYSIVSTDFSVIYSLSKEDFEKVLKMQNLYNREVYCYLKENILHYNQNDQLNQFCKLCQQKNHEFQLCPNLFLVPQKYLAIARSQYSQKNERFSLKRKKKRDTNSLKNSTKIAVSAQTFLLNDLSNLYSLGESELDSDSMGNSSLRNSIKQSSEISNKSWRVDFAEGIDSQEEIKKQSLNYYQNIKQKKREEMELQQLEGRKQLWLEEKIQEIKILGDTQMEEKSRLQESRRPHKQMKKQKNSSIFGNQAQVIKNKGNNQNDLFKGFLLVLCDFFKKD